jgi:hypothetical protein
MLQRRSLDEMSYASTRTQSIRRREERRDRKARPTASPLPAPQLMCASAEMFIDWRQARSEGRWRF